jgi:hypothetical protein
MAKPSQIYAIGDFVKLTINRKKSSLRPDGSFAKRVLDNYTYTCYGLIVERISQRQYRILWNFTEGTLPPYMKTLRIPGKSTIEHYQCFEKVS